jgi:hypothetical protein
MNDTEWMNGYNKGSADTRDDLIEWLELLASTGKTVIEVKFLVGQIKGRGYER